MNIQDGGNQGVKRIRGAKKGENRFKDSQEKKVARREEILIKELEQLEINHASFSKVTYLASHIADVITKEMGLKKPVATSTLMRNDVYKVHLLEYMKKQASKFEVSNDLEAIKQRLKQSNYTASVEHKAKALEAQLERLRKENKQLKDYITNQVKLGVDKPFNGKELSVIEYSGEVDKLCEVIDIMLRKSQGRYRLSEEGIKIMPRAMVIADNDLITSYLAWKAERVIERG